MAHLLHRQPFKGVYITYTVLANLIRFPVLFLLAIPKSWRPRPSWSIKRTMHVHVLKLVFKLAGSVGPLNVVPNHLDITPGVGVNGVWVEPVPKLVTGELESWATGAGVEGVRIPGYWLHKTDSTIDVAAPPAPGEKIVYALHGGAYTRLSGHPSDVPAKILKGVLEHVGAVQRVFSLEYRLSSTAPYPDANPFPAALLDALAGYVYLTNVVGCSPDDIIIEGDSAGGNLALALVRYLVDYRGTPGLPAPPHALLLLSPWADLSDSHFAGDPAASYRTCYASDYLGNPKDTRYSRAAFCGPFGLGAAASSPYISPASLHNSASFHGFPRTFIVAGGAEVLRDSIVTLRDRMVRDLGEDKVMFYLAEDAIHDYLVFEWHEPERSQTLKAIETWLAEV